MTVKDILLALAPRNEVDPACDYALSLAEAYGAHVTAAVYGIVPDIPGSVFSAFAADLVQKTRDEAEAAVRTARDKFEQAAQAAGINHTFHGSSSVLHAAASDFAARLRTSDIGILTQHLGQLDRYGDLFTEAALFRSGRPIVIVPRGHSGRFSNERVLIAWDGSLHATRAIAGAMPFLAGANIEVLTVEEASKGLDFRGSALVEHLRRHGMDAGLAERDDRDIPAAILKQAESFRASLVVMGGYAHSRFREFVFGGATRLMLSDMAVPVLMAH